MRNLLNESFSRLFKTKSFKVCLFINIIMPAFMIGLMKYLSVRLNDEPNMSADDNLFFMTGMLPIFISIGCGLFIAKDFQQNTVRNKIICGYSRTAIYMTNWITSAFITLLYHFASTIVAVVLSAALFQTGELFTKVNLYYSLACIPILLSFTSITVAMTMSIRNTAGAIFSFVIHELSGMVGLLTFFIKSAGFAKFLNYFIPMSQLSIIQMRNYNDGMFEIDTNFSEIMGYMIPEGFDAVAIPLYSIILIVAVTALGIWNFNKKDIK